MKSEYSRFTLKQKIWIAVTAAVIIICAAMAYILTYYRVNNVEVVGNSHYTTQEIEDMVLKGNLFDNSLLLNLKYRNKSIENVPFVEKMDVEVIGADSIRIMVYEKKLAGCVSYLGNYMYFDRDGIVVESSLEASSNVPEVLGLSFNYVIIHEKLPVEKQEVFEEILDITQLLSKYNLHANKIFFDSEYNVYLYFDGIEVSIGTKDYIDEKIIQLQYILPNLEGKSGILEMKDFNEDTKNVTFEEKKQ